MISGSLPPVSNREDLKLQFELYDEDTNELINVSSVTEVVVEVVSRGENTSRDYGPSSQTGNTVLTAKLSKGTVTQPELGIFECTFTASQMSSGLCAGTYDIGGTLTKDSQTVQFLLGTLPVLNGVVSR